MATLAQMIDVMTAALDGATIQMKYKADGEDGWRDVQTVLWNWAQIEYRVKPVLREYAIVVTPGGRPIGVGSTIDGVIPVGKCHDLMGSTVIKVREVLD